MNEEEKKTQILHHKLLEPMTVILGQIGILLEGLAGDLNDDQKARLLKIKEASEKLINNIREHLKGSF